MELILGQQSRVVACSRFTVLSDELTKITANDTKVVIISCLTNIVLSLMTTQDIKTSVEKAMNTLGSVIRTVVAASHGNIKILVAPCTPRTTVDFSIHSKYALVRYLY
jgi:hypothetical protein